MFKGKQENILVLSDYWCFYPLVKDKGHRGQDHMVVGFITACV